MDNTLGQAYRSDDDYAVLLPDVLPVPTHVLARWAAFASQRASPALLPRQDVTHT